MSAPYKGLPRRRPDPMPSPVMAEPRSMPDLQPATADDVVLPPAPGARDLGDPRLSRRAQLVELEPEPAPEPAVAYPSFDRSAERRRPTPAAPPEPDEPFELPSQPGSRDLGDPRESRRARERKA